MLSLEYIHSIFQYSPTASLILFAEAPHFKIAYANEEFLKTTNTKINDIIGKGIFEFYAEVPEKDAKLKRLNLRYSITHVLQLKKPHEVIVQACKHPWATAIESDPCDWKLVAYPLLGENNQVDYITLTATVMTAGKNIQLNTPEKYVSEQDLLASEKRYKALIQDGSDLIAIIDLAGNYKYVNSTTKLILDLEPEYFIGKNVFNFIHEEDKKRVQKNLDSLSFMKRVKIEPFRFLGTNQQYHWLESIITNMSEDPAVQGIVTNSRVVTQRIEDEIRVKNSMERYNIVSQATSDAIYDWDVLSDKIQYNEGFEEIFGHEHSEAWTFKLSSKLVHPEDFIKIDKSIQQSIENKNSRSKQEYRFRCADGTYKYVMDRSFFLYDEDGKLFRVIGSLQDITERINYIQAMEAQNQCLNEISWMQCHVVRAPLARILGLSELLSYNEQDAEKKQLLSHLSRSAAELDRIIKKIIKKTEEIH
jgi:PAS domain S-box-containing protein